MVINTKEPDLTGIKKEIKQMFEQYKKDNLKELGILVTKETTAAANNMAVLNAQASKEFYKKHNDISKEVESIDTKFKTIKLVKR